MLGNQELGRFFEVYLGLEDEHPYLSLFRDGYYTNLSTGEKNSSFYMGHDKVNRVQIGLAEWGPFINLNDQAGRSRLRAYEANGGSALETLSESGDVSGRIIQQNSNTSLEIYDGKKLQIKVPNQ